MSDITEREEALLMIELKLQLLEIGLKSLSDVLEACTATVDALEQTVKEIYGSRD